jgi:hypothetical protein
MTDITQMPAEVNLKFCTADYMSYLLDFDMSLAGYTFSAKVEHSTSTDITVTNTDLAAGKITISLTNAQITAIGTGSFLWYLDLTTGATKRRYLAGTFTIESYP